ncbi:MAG: AAA family ATPase [Alphaproteobacteria bacterium]|nr:AAA family ATPase [Alphaproteobacteria bacterium]
MGDVGQRIALALSNEIVISVVAALILTLAAIAIRPIREFFSRAGTRLRRSWSAEVRLERALEAVNSRGVWLDDPIEFPESAEQYMLRMRNSIPILTIANLKGGVGKTTIAANLAAHFHNTSSEERLLLIDLDFQGSLSSMLVHREHMLPLAGQSKTARTLAADMAPGEFLDILAPVNDMSRAKALTAYYDVAAVENRVLVRWLLGEEGGDVRYRLAKILLSQQVQTAFTKIIIDAPPRMTIGAVQAFCASTHVLIPTVLDKLSGDAVSTFVNELIKLRNGGVCPHIELLGVVGSMTNHNIGKRLDDDPDADPPMTVAERQGVAAIRAALGRVQKDNNLMEPPVKLLPPDTYIQRLAAIASQAGEAPTYLNGGETVREMFDRLGREVELRLSGA